EELLDLLAGLAAAAGRTAVRGQRAGHAGAARLAGAGRAVHRVAVRRLVAARLADRLRVVGARVASQHDYAFDVRLHRLALQRGHGPLGATAGGDFDAWQIELRQVPGADVGTERGADVAEIPVEGQDLGLRFGFDELLGHGYAFLLRRE